MDRQQLARAIDVGRASTLNCFETTKDLAAIAADIAPDDPRGPLFRTRTLNESIIFKVVISSQRNQRRSFGIDTLIYFPFNHANIYEGGDSILYGDPQRTALLQHKCGLDPRNEQRADETTWDNNVLSMLDALPTLDPFLLRCKAQQYAIEDQIHPGYFDITLEEWERIQQPIRTKIDALIRKARGLDDGETPPEIQKHVSRFLAKIWEARDVNGIEDFVRGLDIPVGCAPDLFFAWKAICYYETQFLGLEVPMKRMFAWFGDPKRSLPVDFGALRAEQQDSLRNEMNLLRARLRDNYRQTVAILSEYEESYRLFIEEGKPAAFKAFLNQADTHYIDLAGCLSANTHAINLLDDQRQRFGDGITADQHRRLIDCLLALFGIELDTPGEPKRRRPVPAPVFVD